MYLRPKDRQIGKENFWAAIGSKPVRREFLEKAAREGLTARKGLGAYYFKYDKKLREPLRVGVIGAGDQGRRLIAAVNADFLATKSIADLRPSNQKRATESIKDVKTYGPYQELLAKAKDDGLEAVIIALPSHLHAPAALAAMKAGLHVFVEPPMALTVRDAKQMARAAKQGKLCLAVGQQRRYSILYDNALELVRDGIVDDVHYIRAQWHVKKEEDDKADKKKGERKVDWWRNVPKEDAGVKVKEYGYASVDELAHWQLWEKLSGGMMMELGCQLVDAASLFLAAMPNRHNELAYPLSVAGSGSQLLPGKEGDADDHAYCVFEYPVAGYTEKGPQKARKKVGLQYDLITGNDFDGYGEVVLGKQGSLVVEREQDAMLYKQTEVDKKLRIVQKKDKDDKLGPPAIDIPKEAPKLGDEESAVIGQVALIGIDPGFAAELEHWAFCVRKAEPANKPHCDAEAGVVNTVIAVAAARAAKEAIRIEFQKEWFDVDKDDSPDAEQVSSRK